MNERIKDLLEQAGVKYVTMPKDTVYEKFAELIIKECISVVDYDDGATHVRELLLEHFGVE
jgi:hypothetical protein